MMVFPGIAETMSYFNMLETGEDMTDWLSEIETRNRSLRHGPHRPLPESWSERMARVLRELVEYIKLETMPMEPLADVEVRVGEYNNLSDDAKELFK